MPQPAFRRVYNCKFHPQSAQHRIDDFKAWIGTPCSMPDSSATWVHTWRTRREVNAGDRPEFLGRSRFPILAGHGQVEKDCYSFYLFRRRAPKTEIAN
jgi:hypothetical protein